MEAPPALSRERSRRSHCDVLGEDEICDALQGRVVGTVDIEREISCQVYGHYMAMKQFEQISAQSLVAWTSCISHSQTLNCCILYQPEKIACQLITNKGPKWNYCFILADREYGKHSIKITEEEGSHAAAERSKKLTHNILSGSSYGWRNIIHDAEESEETWRRRSAKTDQNVEIISDHVRSQRVRLFENRVTALGSEDLGAQTSSLENKLKLNNQSSLVYLARTGINTFS